MKKTQIYQTSDGEFFTDPLKAIRHEKIHTVLRDYRVEQEDNPLHYIPVQSYEEAQSILFELERNQELIQKLFSIKYKTRKPRVVKDRPQKVAA